EVLRQISRHLCCFLVEGLNLVESGARKAEDWSVQGRDGAIDLSIETEGGIEFGLFKDDVGQPAFLGLAADADVQVVLQRPKHGIRQGDCFFAFRWWFLRLSKTPGAAGRMDERESQGYSNR